MFGVKLFGRDRSRDRNERGDWGGVRNDLDGGVPCPTGIAFLEGLRAGIQVPVVTESASGSTRSTVSAGEF